MDTLFRDLQRLCNADGAAGLNDIVRVASELLEPFCDSIYTDTMGNLLATRHGNDTACPPVMLQAHMDEIGMLVTHIDDGGFVHVTAAGGVDKRMLATQSVCVHGSRKIKGVFCSVPPHLLKEDDKHSVPEDNAIDIGMEAAAARSCIPLGSRVTYAPNYARLGDSTVTSKALDDRCGMMAIIDCLRRLQGVRANVTVAFCVQEELGCRGAAVAARALMPEYAFVTDVSFALAPGEQPRECGRLGEGVMIGHSPILDQKLTDMAIRLADKHNVPFQHEVMGGRTGTDADVISNSNTGIQTALLSIPERYMHSPVEVVDLRDVAAVGELMALCVEEVSRIG